MTAIVVIGGGVSGLAAACLLARDGHHVTLLERQSTFGGRAGTWKKDGFTFDTGPSWYLMPEVFEHFYAMMGTSVDEQLTLARLDPGYRVHFESQPDALDLPTGAGRAAPVFERIEKGAGGRLSSYLRSATRTYQAAIASFLYNPFSSWRSFTSRTVLRSIPAVVPLLSRSLWSFVSVRFTDNRLRQVLGYPAVFLGTSPYEAPALYHLMSHMDLVDGVRYPIGGFGRFVESLVQLARDNGVTLIADADVTTIRSDDGAVSSVEYTAARQMHTLVADIVVSAIDEHHTESVLLSRADRSYRSSRWQKQITGPSAVLVLAGVTGTLPQLAHHTLFFSADWKENFSAIFGSPGRVPNPPSLYVCKPSATDDVAPEGNENIFVLVPLPPDTEIGRGGEGTTGDHAVTRIADQAIAQIASWAGIPDLAERIVVKKTIGPQDFAEQFNTFRGSALGPAHTLKQSAFFRGITRSRRVRGLYYAGATTVPGVGLPMCLISAELVLKHVRGDTSPGPLEEP